MSLAADEDAPAEIQPGAAGAVEAHDRPDLRPALAALVRGGLVELQGAALVRERHLGHGPLEEREDPVDQRRERREVLLELLLQLLVHATLLRFWCAKSPFDDMLILAYCCNSVKPPARLDRI